MLLSSLLGGPKPPNQSCDLRMVQNTIAIICDCDGTLCSDTATKLISKLGLAPDQFWREVAALVEDGWDPPLAWLNRLLELARRGEIEPITRNLLRGVGRSTELYPGA